MNQTIKANVLRPLGGYTLLAVLLYALGAVSR